MKVALDIRLRVLSGRSTNIRNFLPYIYEQADSDTEFVLIRYADQPLAELTQGRPTIISNSRGDLGDLIWTNLTLPKLLRRHRVDVYHGLKLFGPLCCPVPMVHTAGSISRSRRGEFPFSLRQHLSWGIYGSYLYQKSAKVIAVSKYVAQFLEKDLRIERGCIEEISSPLDDQTRLIIDQTQSIALEKSPTQGAPFIFCSGNIVPVKNHATVVRALADIADRTPHHLVIAGACDTPCAAQLKQLIVELKLESRVHLVGFLSTEQLVGYLKAATLLVHPSFSEGYAMSILEGLACGLAVIGSNRGGIPESIGPGGRLIDDPADHHAMAQQILTLTNDDEARLAMARVGREHALALNWPDHVRETLGVYRACLNGA